MIRKDLANQRVIKAISLGLATTMTMMTPMTALAETTTPEPQYEDVENGVADAAQTEADDAKTAIGNESKEGIQATGAIATVEQVYETDAAGLDPENELPGTGTALDNALDNDPTVKDDLKNASADIEAAEDQMLVVEGTADTSAKETDVNKAEKKVDTDVTNAATAVSNGKQANANAMSAESEINAKADDANKKADELNKNAADTQKIADDAADIITKANEEINGVNYAPGEEPAGGAAPSLQDEFNAAKNAAGMSAAYNKMTAIVDKAEEDFNNKLADYNTAKSAYNALESEYAALYVDYVAAYGDPENVTDGTYLAKADKASGDYDAAKKNFDDASEAFNKDLGEYAAAVKSLNDQITLYNGAIDAASAEAQKAYSKLADAKAKLDALKTAADAAYNEVNNSLTASAQAIETAQNNYAENKTDETKFNLFKSYVENFYVPEKMGGSDAEVSMTAVEKASTSTLSYFKLTYKDAEGKDAVKYLNYSINENGDVTLYEISDLLVKANEELISAEEETGKTDLIAYYKNGTSELIIISKATMTGNEFTDINGNKIVKATKDKNGNDLHGKYFLVDANGERTELGVTPAGSYTSTDNGVNVLEVVSHGDSTVEYKHAADGTVVKTVTTPVTTVTYHEASLSDESFKSREAAEAAMKAAIGELTDNDEVVTSEVTERTATEEYTETYTEDVEKSEMVTVDEYTASGEYVSSFEKTIKLSSDDYTGYTALWEDYEDDIKEKQDDVKEDINDQFRKYSEGNVVNIDSKKCLVLSATLGDITYSDPSTILFEGHGHFTVDGSANVTATVAAVETKTLSKNDAAFISVLEEYGYRTWQSWDKVGRHFEWDWLNSGWVDDYNWVEHDNFADAVNNYFNAQTGLQYKNLSGSGDTYYFDYVAKETITGDKQTAVASRDASEQATNNRNAKDASKTNLESKTAGKTLVSDISYITTNADKEVKYTKPEEKTRPATREITVYDYSVKYNKYIGTDTVNQSNVTTFKGIQILDSHGSSVGEHNRTDISVGAYELASFLQKNDTLLEKYQTLSSDVTKAQDAVSEVQGEVDALLKQINGYEKEITGLKQQKKSIQQAKVKAISTWQIAKYEADLKLLTETIAINEEALEIAMTTLDELKGQLADNQKILENQIEKERREEEARRQQGGGENTNYTPGTATSDTDDTVVAAAAPVRRTQATANINAAQGEAGVGRAAVAGARRGQGGLDDETAGIDVEEKEIVASSDNKKKVVEDPVGKKVEINDSEVPLAGSLDVEEDGMSWWWLLIVALLGATGTAMYEKHKKNKAAKATQSTAKEKSSNKKN